MRWSIIGAFAIPLLLGIDMPLGFRLLIAILAAFMFAGVSVVFSTHILACRTDGDRVENVFPALAAVGLSAPCIMVTETLSGA